MKKPFYFLALICWLTLLCACTSVNLVSAPPTAQTKTSAIIELQQTPIDQHTIYLQWQNSLAINASLESQIVTALKKAGYRFVSDQQKAHYQLQISLLQMGLANQDQLYSILVSDYGDALLTLQPVMTSSDNVKTPPYSDVVNVADLFPVMTLDLQVSEMVETNTWNRYQTRLISASQQPNVTFKQMQLLMNKEIVSAIVEIFPANLKV